MDRFLHHRDANVLLRRWPGVDLLLRLPHDVALKEPACDLHSEYCRIHQRRGMPEILQLRARIRVQRRRELGQAMMPPRQSESLPRSRRARR
ncbi:hypothetical protein AMAG_08238 [Allomyces macrogynus ATCC 38327]|uniref:Uncharacterized protein n=1 Tax=Allomyces macrogynus (strain ATCC 38327) TaxID=578462 RepID=A0A0L0SKN0_ALLM3|nr:hypothetical protein AMAG_08238 [Allomyces macrogynus ATCC 38327]|eukprot:KNE63072.1 hypothetical protein AMAG_08238 [Allomyces macrogynus ATCC 38327]